MFETTDTARQPYLQKGRLKQMVGEIKSVLEYHKETDLRSNKPMRTGEQGQESLNMSERQMPRREKQLFKLQLNLHTRTTWYNIMTSGVSS